MYFDGTTLAALLSDADLAAANAPAIAADGRAQTSAFAVIEAAMELPELGEAGVTAFLDEHGIELRDLPPDNRLIAGVLAAEGKLKARLHATCAAYYETEFFVPSDGEAEVPAVEAALPAVEAEVPAVEAEVPAVDAVYPLGEPSTPATD